MSSRHAITLFVTSLGSEERARIIGQIVDNLETL